jgi:hypothetical protein
MRRKTVKLLATLCCALGVALVVVGAMLCPQSLYANQGTASFSPCDPEGCDSGCSQRPTGQCGSGMTKIYCDAIEGILCDQCRCKPSGVGQPPCLCF